MFYFSEYNIVSFELLQKEDIDDIIDSVTSLKDVPTRVGMCICQRAF